MFCAVACEILLLLSPATMRFSIAALALGLISLSSAKRSPQHVGKKLPQKPRPVARQPFTPTISPNLGKRAKSKYATAKTESKYVDFGNYRY